MQNHPSISSLVFCSKFVGYSETNVVSSLLGLVKLLIVALGGRHGPVLVALVLDSLVNVDVLGSTGGNLESGGIREIVFNSSSEREVSSIDTLGTAPVVGTFKGVSGGVVKLVVASSADILAHEVSSQPEDTRVLWSVDELGKSFLEFLKVMLSIKTNVGLLLELNVDLWGKKLSSSALVIELDTSVDLSSREVWGAESENSREFPCLLEVLALNSSCELGPVSVLVQKFSSSLHGELLVGEGVVGSAVSVVDSQLGGGLLSWLACVDLVVLPSRLPQSLEFHSNSLSWVSLEGEAPVSLWICNLEVWVEVHAVISSSEKVCES